MSRRSTSQAVHKLGRNPRDREREIQDEYWLEDERESFPQFCMTCEKQFVPQDEKFLYCSEACRATDQHNAPLSSTTPRSHSHSDRSGHYYPFYAAGDPEPRDIIPRANVSSEVLDNARAKSAVTSRFLPHQYVAMVISQYGDKSQHILYASHLDV
ncbi:hypothetical protein VP1G_07972 [Cytospora mali]|uniref:Life-span regulatory factor domain-containing protein n=1 Tax=Cytospora mali TaxID=578113 RepID=A0A194VA76_CYTMA|nr:hypothetical protein VP1G_07972 [Valsa mali var. pyri (nom. inval.)]